MSDNPDSSMLFTAVVASLLLVVGGAWLFLSLRTAPSGDPGATATPGPVPGPETRLPPAGADETPMEQLLLYAGLALEAGQLVEPAGSSALDFYRRALDRRPDDPEAVAGLEAVIGRLLRDAEATFEAEDYVAFGRHLRALEKAAPGDAALASLRDRLQRRVSARLAFVDAALEIDDADAAQSVLDSMIEMPGVPDAELDARVARLATVTEALAQRESERALAREAAAEAEAATPAAASQDAPGDPVTELIESARRRLADDRLLLPQDDNAVSLFRQALQLDPGNVSALSGLRNAVQRLARRALDAAGSGNWDAAESALRQAESVQTASDITVRAREDVVAMRIAEETSQLYPVSRFQVTNVVRPRFPPRALRNQVEGWVMVDFTVSENGEPEDIVVSETSERYSRQFAAAAVEAVSQWRFEPREFMGRRIAQRTRTRVNFELVD